MYSNCFSVSSKASLIEENNSTSPSFKAAYAAFIANFMQFNTNNLHHFNVLIV